MPLATTTPTGRTLSLRQMMLGAQTSGQQLHADPTGTDGCQAENGDDILVQVRKMSKICFGDLFAGTANRVTKHMKSN